MTVVEITSESHFNELTTSLPATTPITLSFHTSWAAPCAQMNAVFNYLSTQYTDIAFLSVDAEAHPEVSETFDVSAVPFFVFIKSGKVVRELSGADPKELSAAIQELSGQKPAGEPAPTVENGTDKDATAEEDLNARLAKLVNAAPVMLFMKGTPAAPQCGFSRQLVGILRENQVRFGFFDILKDDAVRNGLKTFSDWPTFPQLYVNGELQGGLDIVKEILVDDPNYFKNL
ncbi:thioredoxin-like protein [Lipomyces tetrasporus]|uniref:Thioredoxin-like protein n=1 Tax=Lipomyces tetrasporus TaxID=54092 RepID=A0AAD7VP10_9ASCO|nr:thioredoxin-like protein [Lipomyces tetrasporus]KAJ8097147.1 thioredoxin-like protein [Lipomyces tetrasporus]